MNTCSVRDLRVFYRCHLGTAHRGKEQLDRGFKQHHVCIQSVDVCEFEYRQNQIFQEGRSAE